MLSPLPSSTNTLPPTGNTSRAIGVADNVSSTGKATIAVPLEKSQNPNQGQSSPDNENKQVGITEKPLTPVARDSRNNKVLSDVSQLTATSPSSTYNQGSFAGHPLNSRNKQTSNQPFDFSGIPDGSYPSTTSPDRLSQHIYRNSYAYSGENENHNNEGVGHQRVQSFPPSNIVLSSPSNAIAVQDTFLQRIFRDQGSYSLESSPARQPRNTISYDVNSQMNAKPLPLHSPISIGLASAHNNPPMSATSSNVDKDVTDNPVGSVTPVFVPPSPQNSCNSHNGSFKSSNNNTPIIQPNLYISSTPSDVSNTSSRSLPCHTQNQANTNYPSNQSQTSSEINNNHDNNAQALILGLQQLERQQAELEARQSKQILPTTIHLDLNSQYSQMPPPQHPPPPFDDLDNNNIFVPLPNNNHIVENTLSPGSNWNNLMPPTPAVPLNGRNHNFNNHQDLNQQSETNNFFANLRDLETEKEKNTRSFGRLKWTPMVSIDLWHSYFSIPIYSTLTFLFFFV